MKDEGLDGRDSDKDDFLPKKKGDADDKLPAGSPSSGSSDEEAEKF